MIPRRNSRRCIPVILTCPAKEVSSVYGCGLSCTTGWARDRPESRSAATSSSSVTHSSSSISATAELDFARPVRTSDSVSLPLKPTRPATDNFSKSTNTRESSGLNLLVNSSSPKQL